MSVRMIQLKSREEWLEHRKNYIGGSSAASILGLNPWMSNVQLWELKTGRRKKTVLDDNEFVKYGHAAEPHLRELFKLDFPEYKVSYVDNNSFLNDRYPFGAASLDGWLEDEEGRKGILEIKTSNMLNSMSKDKWKDQIPDNYYCQVLWYLGITEFDFAIVKAQLRSEYEGNVSLITKHYYIDRKDVGDDINLLMQKGAEFYEAIIQDKCPPLILPRI